jgi:hypothetical protein
MIAIAFPCKLLFSQSAIVLCTDRKNPSRISRVRMDCWPKKLAPSYFSEGYAGPGPAGVGLPLCWRTSSCPQRSLSLFAMFEVFPVIVFGVHVLFTLRDEPSLLETAGQLSGTVRCHVQAIAQTCFRPTPPFTAETTFGRPEGYQHSKLRPNKQNYM